MGTPRTKPSTRILIPEMAKRMCEIGSRDFIYVNDSALITQESLHVIDECGLLFVSLLPQVYNECKSAITLAVRADNR